MLKQKKLGLGVEDFKEIITFDYYYIDKTKFIEDILFDGAKILDIGTGGGFPGIPLAILYPNCEFTLIDSIGKKIKV